MKKQEEILRRAIEAARSQGIQVHRGGGAMFDWTGSKEQPRACDATGAVLLLMGRTRDPGWFKELCAFLDVDGFWFFRFWCGWDRNYQVQIWDDENDAWVNDDVSHFARRLAREVGVV